MKRSSRPNEKWIHSFAVTDVCLHPKKFTVYKVTSVVFPIDIPEALTCLTVWKRFNDIKWLLKYVKKRHKEYKLPDTVPTLNNHVYFKRFEADVITERKLFIIRLLDYIGQHPILYKSQAFQEFFAKGQSMPAEERLQFDDALFEQTVESNEIANKKSESQDSAALSASSSMSESVYSQLTSSSSSLIDGCASTDPSVDLIDGMCSTVDSMMPTHYQHHTTTNYGQLIETPKMPNQRDDLSQFKVLRTFGNVMQVQDSNTKHVYIMKSIFKSADVVDDTYLPANFPFMVSLVAYYLSDSNVYLLLEQASGGKLFDYIRSYDRKSAEKGQQSLSDFLSASNALVSTPAYKTNPIKIPQPVSTATAVAPSPSPPPTDKNCKRNAAANDYDGDSFYHLLQSYYNKSAASDDTVTYSNSCETVANSVNNEAPHFDLIANDLDVNNLLQCSKKLLNSVSHTLHKIQNHRIDENAIQENDSLFEDSGESGDEDVVDRTDVNEIHSIHSNLMTLATSDDFPVNEYSTEEDEGYYRVAIRLPKAILRRWFREIIFAIKHLHANHIYCYDLQPDNLLLGKNGEILLTYFYRREFTAYFDVKSLNKSCYSSVYIAPERPLTALSDIWSVGVIFFELVTGTSFQSCHPNGILSYYDIQYPEDFDIDINTRDLLEGLLQINPDHRLRLDEIEAHPFFNSI